LRIVPKKWSEFQHYKDRAPPWIKLQHKLLDDFDFQSLPIASKALAPMLWLIASEHPAGEIDASAPNLAFRLRTTAGAIEEALKPLIDGRFFIPLDGDASEPLALRKHVAIPEGEGEGEAERETPLVPLPRDGGRKGRAERQAQALEVLDFLNARAGRHFRPVPQSLKFIEARLFEGVTLQDLKTLTVRKCREWLGTEHAKYLRPETLFNATKCHSYLGEIAPEEPECSAPNATATSSSMPPPAPVAGMSPPTPRGPSPRPTTKPSADAAHGSPEPSAATSPAVSATPPAARARGTAASTFSRAAPPTARESSNNRAPPARSASSKPRQWWETPAGRAAKGREQDIERRTGETEEIFTARLFARMGPGPWLEGLTPVAQRMVEQFTAKAPGQ
jgi:uncharacterized phage protein (TIGR02220 family)